MDLKLFYACITFPTFCHFLFIIIFVADVNAEELSIEEYVRRQLIYDSFVSRTKQTEEHWIEPYNVHYSPTIDDLDTKRLLLTDSIPFSHLHLLEPETGETINLTEGPLEDAYFTQSPYKSSVAEYCSKKESILEKELRVLFGLENKLDVCLVTTSSAKKSSVQDQSINSTFTFRTKVSDKNNSPSAGSKKLQKHILDLAYRPKTVQPSKASTTVGKKYQTKTSVGKRGYAESSRENELSFSDCARVKIYLQRWLNILSKKLITIEGKPVTVSIGLDTLKKLKTKDLELHATDEIFIQLVSSLTVRNSQNWDDFIPYSKWLKSLPWFNIPLFIVLLALALYSVIHLVFFARAKTVIIALFLFTVVIVVLSAVHINTQKLYKLKMAHKQHTLSSTAPSMCQSFITERSGIFDHIRESFRYYFYHDQCKKYFESLMVEPELEVNFVLSFVDLLSDTCFAVLPNLFKALNYSVKDGLRGASFSQICIILILFVFLMLICFRYKIRLPGISFEPSVAGSRVQELNYAEIKAVGTNSSLSKHAVEYHKESKQSSCSYEKSRISRNCVLCNPEKGELPVDAKKVKVKIDKKFCNSSTDQDEGAIICSITERSGSTEIELINDTPVDFKIDQEELSSNQIENQ